MSSQIFLMSLTRGLIQNYSFITGQEQMNVSVNLNFHHSMSHLGKASLKDLIDLSYHVEATQVYLFQTEHPCHKEVS